MRWFGLKSYSYIIAVILAASIWCSPAYAAITHDTDCNGAATTSPLTVSCTVGSLTSGLLLCAATSNNGASATDWTITWNGSSLSAFTSLVSGFGNQQIQIFYIVAPASGTHNIVLSSSIVSNLNLACTSFDGVNQSTPINNSNTNHGGGAGFSSLSVTLTLNAGNLLWGGIAATDQTFSNTGGPTTTPGAGQTETANFSNAGSAIMTTEASYKTSASDMSWSLSGYATIFAVAAVVEVKAGSGGGGGGNVRHRVVQ